MVLNQFLRISFCLTFYNSIGFKDKICTSFKIQEAVNTVTASPPFPLAVVPTALRISPRKGVCIKALPVPCQGALESPAPQVNSTSIQTDRKCFLSQEAEPRGQPVWVRQSLPFGEAYHISFSSETVQTPVFSWHPLVPNVCLRAPKSVSVL